MQTILKVKKAEQRCVACKGCNRVSSSAQCEHKCERWFQLRIKEVSRYVNFRIPNFV